MPDKFFATRGQTVMRTLLVVALFTTATVAAPVPKELKARKSVEARILGTWLIVNTDVGPLPYSMTITFKKGGEMAFGYTYPNNRLPPRVSPGKFKAGEPNDIYKLGSIDWVVFEGNGQRGEVSKLLKLTATEMEFEDPQGRKDVLVRVNEKGK